jgi:hypothetical protein
MARTSPRRPALLLASLVGCTVLAVTAATATATAATSRPLTTSTPGLVTVFGVQGGKAGWASVDYLKTHPGAIRGVTITPRGESKPQSASGCNQNVCIYIDGDSTTVVGWETTAYGNTGCANAMFSWHEGAHRGETVCPDSDGPGVYYDTTGPTGYYPAGDHLCNFWHHGPSGLPCEDIEAVAKHR